MAQAGAVSSLKATQDYLRRAREALPGGWLGDLSMPEGKEIVAKRGQGSRVWDVDGREFLDLVCGSGSLILGHAPESVSRAVAQQAAEGSHFYSLNDRAIELAERLIRIIPCAETVRFANSGSEATFYALRLARAFTGRQKILKFEGSYVGHHDYGLHSVKPPPSNRPLEPYVDSAGIPAAINDLVLVAPYNDLDVVARLLDESSGEVAAIIAEPVQRAIPPAPGFLQGLRELATKHGALLVFDEVVTGFRLALGGGQERFGVVPDLAAFGKAIANGFALAAVAGRRDIMRLADPVLKGQPEYVYISGTLSGNPLSCAASLATLDELEKPGTYEQLNKIGQYLADGFTGIFREIGAVGCVSGVGSMFQVFFGIDRVPDYRAQIRADMKPFEKLWNGMFAKGIFMSRRAKNYVSTAHSAADVDRILSTARAILKHGG